MHALLFWLLRLPERAPPPPGTLRVRLQAPPPLSPPPPERIAHATPASAGGGRRNAPPPLAKADGGVNTARMDARDMHRAPHALYTPPPVRHRGLPAAEPSRLPELADAFRPLPGAFEICGRMVQVSIGAQDVSMPTTYRCKDRRDEFRRRHDDIAAELQGR